MSELYPEDFECDHLDASLDILTGRLTCDCGFTKWLTTAEYKAREDFERRAAEAFDAYIAEVTKADDEAGL